MKTPKILTLALGLSVLAFFSGCQLFDGFCPRGSGTPETRTLSMPAINGITLAVAGKVNISQGLVQQVEVTGYPNLLDILKTDVSSGHWRIEFDENCVRNNDDFVVNITVTDLEQVRIAGSGSIEGQTPFFVNDVDVEISGSGDINMDLAAANIFSTISGSGNIFLKGLANRHTLDISGSGDFHGFDLISQHSDVNIAGSGSADVHAVQTLKVRISGSGNVQYKGSPSVDVSVSGSGKVSKKD